jgi:hypothetical protein
MRNKKNEKQFQVYILFQIKQKGNHKSIEQV